MFGFGPATRIYVATGATDMRKGFNGLYGLVRDHLGCDPEFIRHGLARRQSP
jgi:transposase